MLIRHFVLRRRPSAVATLAFAAIVCGHAVAFAQATSPSPPARTPQGLFGAVGRSETAPNRLDFTASLIEGYDSDVPAEFRRNIDQSSLVDGFSTIFSTSMDYAWTGRRAQVGATASSAWRYYNELGETRSAGYSAGLGASFQLSRRTTLFANQAAAYLPTYLYGIFPTGVDLAPGATPPTAQDFSTNEFRSYTYVTSAALGHDFTSRSRMSLDGDFSYTDRLDETPQWRDVDSHRLQGEYAHDVGRNTALTARYAYRSGEFGYGVVGTTTEHSLNVGVNYTRPLSATRRAVLSFSIGPSGADIPQTIGNTTVVRRQYQAVSEAGFAYDFGRSWTARANYRRGLEYVVDLPEPVYADSVGAGVAGLLSRRVDLSLSAAYSSGESLLNLGSTLFDTYTGDVRLRYALTRTFAAYAEYLYYYYDFREGAQLLAGIPAGLERNGVRLGLTLWVPALGR